MATAQVGWGRLGYNIGAWNTTPDAVATITGQYLQTEIDFGAGWSRDTWNAGAWGIGLGAVLTGNGNVFSLSTLTELQTFAGNIGHSGTALIIPTGEEANIELTSALTIVDGEGIFIGIATPNLTASINDINLSTNNFLEQTGQELTIENNLANVVVTASAPIIILGEQLDIDVGQVVTGTANFVDILGQVITVSLNDINVTSGANAQINTGIQANTISGNVSVAEGHGVIITGNSTITYTGNVNIIGISNVNIIGSQANINVSTLKFWDPIQPTITETWTNIH